jgi:chorismate mutase
VSAGPPHVEHDELGAVRDVIQGLDHALIGIIAERVALARRAGALKRAAGLPTLDPSREASIVRRAGEMARAAGLHDEDVRYIYWQLIGMSRRAQLEES